MKTAARAEKVLEQLNKGLPPEVREPDTRENSMEPMPDVTPAKSKIQREFSPGFVQRLFARAARTKPPHRLRPGPLLSAPLQCQPLGRG